MTQQIQTKQLPEGWKEEELGEIGEFKRGPFGSSVQKSVCVRKGKNTYKLYEQGNIINNDFERGTYYLSPKKFNELKGFEMKPGDILITCAGTLGKIAIAPKGIERGIINSVLMRIRLKEEKINKKYFIYFFGSSAVQNDIQSKSAGVALKNLFATKQLKKFKIPIPSLPEQSLIVSEIETQFTRLDEAVKNLKAVKSKLEIYRKAVLKKAFEKKRGWEEKIINKAFTINPSKNEIKDIDENIEVSFIPMAHVSESGKIISMDKRHLKEVKKGFTFFRDNDILLAKITPCFENGKKAIAENLLNGIGFGTTEFYVFRTKGEVIPKWIYFNLSREDFRSGAKRSMGGAVGQQRVSKDFIENFKISFPKSIEEQSLIVSAIESKFSVIDKVEEVVEQSLKKAEMLRKSILKSAFEGKLVNMEEVRA